MSTMIKSAEFLQDYNQFVLARTILVRNEKISSSFSTTWPPFYLSENSGGLLKYSILSLVFSLVIVLAKYEIACDFSILYPITMELWAIIHYDTYCIFLSFPPNEACMNYAGCKRNCFEQNRVAMYMDRSYN